jgi:hypothetical protein
MDTINWRSYHTKKVSEEVGIDTPILVWLNKPYFNSRVHVTSSRLRIIQGTFFWDLQAEGYKIEK